MVPEKYENDLNGEKEFIITARPAKNCNYLAFSKLYDQDFSGVRFYHDDIYISGFQSCQNLKKDSFARYIARND
jgi:hypothetical protein